MPSLRPRLLVPAIACILAISGTALAGSKGTLQVTATVVNTCQFGREVTCVMPGAPISRAPAAGWVIRPEAGAAAERVRILHL